MIKSNYINNNYSSNYINYLGYGNGNGAFDWGDGYGSSYYGWNGGDGQGQTDYNSSDIPFAPVNIKV